MIEYGGVLKTWAIGELPADWASTSPSLTHAGSSGSAVVAERLADHRLDYLEYQGEVSQGRGVVTRAASGCYQLFEYGADRLLVRLTFDEQLGQAKEATLSLTRASNTGDYWILESSLV
jgi:hypothetical protein